MKKGIGGNQKYDKWMPKEWTGRKDKVGGSPFS
jgi:hypothetical protein